MVIIGLGEVKMVVHEIQFRTLYTHFSFGVGDGGCFCWRGSVFFVVCAKSVRGAGSCVQRLFKKQTIIQVTNE